MNSTVRYLAASAWFEAAYWWLWLTGRKHKAAPQYLEDAYNAQAQAWNQRPRRSR